MKKGIVVALFMTLLLAVPTLAASYSAVITVTESGGSSYTMLPVIASIDNQNLADLHIMTSTGLDTRVLQGFTELPHKVADDKVLFVLPVSTGTQYPLEYTFGNTLLTSFPVITGNGGYITMADSSALRLGDNFSVEFDGYVPTTTASSAEIATEALGITPLGTSHTVSLPSGVESGDLLVIVFALGYTGSCTITWPANWTELNQGSLTSGLTSRGGICYKVASGTEGGTVTVTSSNAGPGAYQTFRITGYEGAPVLSLYVKEATSTPNPYKLNPSWGGTGVTLWIPVFCGVGTSGLTVSSYPSGYSGGQFVISTVSGYPCVGSARKSLTSNREDPGQFTVSASVEQRDWTIGIQSDIGATLIGKSGSFAVWCNSTSVSAITRRPSDIEQTTYNQNLQLQSGGNTRAGSRFTASENGYISQLSLQMNKIGSPTGLAYVRVRAASGDTLLGELGSIDVSTLTGAYVWYDFTSPVYVSASQDVRVTLEYAGGGGGSYIQTQYQTTDVLSGHVFTRYYSGAWDDWASNDLAFKIFFGDDAVVSSSCPAGEHKVRVEGLNSTMKLYLEDVESDSTSEVCAATNNANNWIITMPYFDYYKHTVNGTLLVWYQPVAMILGATLPDREGTAQNGVITWGSNPAGISVSVGALLPVSTSSAEVPGTSPDAGASLVPETGNTSTLVPGIEGENLPFYGFFKGLLTSYHDDMGGPEISMPYFWKIVAMIIGWGLGTSVLIVTRHVAFGFIGYIIGFAVPAYAMGGMLDPWIPIVYGMTAACLAALIWKWTASAID